MSAGEVLTCGLHRGRGSPAFMSITRSNRVTDETMLLLRQLAEESGVR